MPLKKILKKFSQTVKEILPAHARDRKIEIWFQDEARVGQQGEVGYIWAKKGTRPRIKKDARFEYAYIFGAICADLRKAAAIASPVANIKAMNEHLKEISIHVDKDSHAVLVMDKAGWHRSDKLKIPDNITIMLLPPKSPELNPQENIWEYLKGNYLKYTVFENYQHIINEIQRAWSEFMKLPEKIYTIGTRNWINV